MKKYLLDEALSRCNAAKRGEALVSIIMPTYNTPYEVFNRAISSILTQSYRNFELLIVDDGSDDCHQEDIRAISAKDSRVKVHLVGHFGVSHARNVGLDMAVGDWIVFADADDEMVSSFISEALSIAEECGADYVIGDVMPRYMDERLHAEPDGRGVFLLDNIEELTAARSQMMGPYHYREFCGPDFHGRGPVAKLYRSSLLGSLRFNESVHIAEDVLFNFEFMERCRKIAIVERAWYLYYQNAFSSIHSPEVESLALSYEGLISSVEDSRWREAVCARCVFDVFYTGVTSFVRNCSFWDARRRSMGLMLRASNLGLFDANVFAQYQASVLIRCMALLCRYRLFSAAFGAWALKVGLSTLLNRHRLFEVEK